MGDPLPPNAMLPDSILPDGGSIVVPPHAPPVHVKPLYRPHIHLIVPAVFQGEPMFTVQCVTTNFDPFFDSYGEAQANAIERAAELLAIHGPDHHVGFEVEKKYLVSATGETPDV